MKKSPHRSIIGRALDNHLYSTQKKQQEELRRKLFGNQGVLLNRSIVRQPDGSGERRLGPILDENPADPEIVMLLAGATDNFTYMQQAFPRTFSFFTRDSETLNAMLNKGIEDALATGRTGAAESILREAREEARQALDRPMKRVSTVDYMVNRVEEIRHSIFDDSLCGLIVVRNANAQDLIDTAEKGGAHRTLVIHGHGRAESVMMTDRIVTNRELPGPEVKLRALVLDTCGSGRRFIDEEDQMGHGIAEEIYGFNRMATPRDLFASKLRKR